MCIRGWGWWEGFMVLGLGGGARHGGWWQWQWSLGIVGGSFCEELPAPSRGRLAVGPTQHGFGSWGLIISTI